MIQISDFPNFATSLFWCFFLNLWNSSWFFLVQFQATTCSRCGARGHGARELATQISNKEMLWEELGFAFLRCWSGSGGKHYDLVEVRILFFLFYFWT